MRRWRRGRVAAVLGLVGVIALLGGLLALSRTAVFRARTIRVEGNVHLRDADVLRIAGIDDQTNVVHLDTDLAVRALTADPWIRSASVTRELPSTVVIRIEERIPVATVNARAVTADGIVLPGASIVGLAAIRSSDGTALENDWQGAASAIGDLPPLLRRRVAVAVVEPDGAIFLAMTVGPDVVWGLPGEGSEKVVALLAVLQWAAGEERRVSRVDVSVPSAPAATMADGSTVGL